MINYGLFKLLRSTVTIASITITKPSMVLMPILFYLINVSVASFYLNLTGFDFITTLL